MRARTPRTQAVKPLRRSFDDRQLRERLRSGGGPVTLVLGAGVSLSRGVPLWSELLRETWKRVFGNDPHARDVDLLDRARQACLRDGLPAPFVDRLGVIRHPLELQFAFERIYEALRWSTENTQFVRKVAGSRGQRSSGNGSNERRAAELFVDVLRKVIYRKERARRRRGAAMPDTLALVARSVQRNAMLPASERRISQVITFNVDDLLEREVNTGCRRRIPWAVPICRASALRPIPSPRSIAVYHLHGFVPLKPSIYPLHLEDGFISKANPEAESLVFTDEQYWRAIGSASGFASRVFLGALSGSCVFLGLSMTDINILRWLANDAIERGDDFRRLTSEWPGSEAEHTLIEELSRHYWISERPASAAEGEEKRDLLTMTLDRRGVSRITIPGWQSKAFHAWWKDCFDT